MAKRSRTERRKNEREAAKLASARMKLASLEPGGNADRPISVTSASTVEVHARSLPCAACGEPGTRVLEHTAEAFGDRRLRVVLVRCARCGVERRLFFAIAAPLPN